MTLLKFLPISKYIHVWPLGHLMQNSRSSVVRNLDLAEVFGSWLVSESLSVPFVPHWGLGFLKNKYSNNSTKSAYLLLASPAKTSLCETHCFINVFTQHTQIFPHIHQKRNGDFVTWYVGVSNTLWLALGMTI